jgi:hypothetical protein
MNDVTQAPNLTFIDVHYHANPDMFIRRHAARSAGMRYANLGGWVILKNHLGCCAAQAWEAHNEGLPVSGSVVLNEIAGGINFRLVQRALALHGNNPFRLLAHFPTVTPHPHRSRMRREVSSRILEKAPPKPLSVSLDNGELASEVLDVLRLARDEYIVISTGHATRDDVFRLVDAAETLGLDRIMLNQPASPMTGLNADDLKNLAKSEIVYTEQTALTHLLGYQSADDFSSVLNLIPRVIYSSDFGQTSQPDVCEWRTMSQKWFEMFSVSERRIDQICRSNALTMLT